MKTLILDNYDSFTFNLYQYIAELGGNPVVFRNDKISLHEIEKMKPTHIIISPGPGTPAKKKDFGICGAVIKKFSKKIPMLGVCLGHQGIIHYLGGRIIRAPEIMHGKTSVVEVLSVAEKMNECRYPNLFRGLPKKFEAMRYHSLMGKKGTIPKNLVVTGKTISSGIIMSIQHRERPLYGIQYHPESIGTPLGKDILKNFLRIKP